MSIEAQLMRVPGALPLPNPSLPMPRDAPGPGSSLIKSDQV